MSDEKIQYFGTDGIRGRVGESLINPEFVLKLGWAIGSVLRAGKDGRVLIGKDTRISGYIFESVLEAGLSAAGIDVDLLGPMPTPAIAYLTRTLRAAAGIVISASHNKYFDNGIKIFSDKGIKIPDEMEKAIEIELQKPLKMIEASSLGKARRVKDAQGRYVEFCKSTFGLNNNLNGLKIVLDCANGATYQVAPAVFRELSADVTVVGALPSGFNINENCGSTHPDLLAATVLREKAHLGIAFDGDGDRVIMVDHKGEIVDGDSLLFIIAKSGFAKGTLSGGVVGTKMSNYGLELSFADIGIPFERAEVGDRHVINMLKKNNWLLGGESSGHIAHLGLTTTGDGIVSALQVLNVLADSGKTLHDLKAEMKKFPQLLINVAIENRIDIDKDPRIKEALLKAEKELNKRGRVLLRNSGTENVVRVMVEGDDEALINRVALELADVVRLCTKK